MTYPGGKSGAGVFQRIINRFPPHAVYIEPFLGGAAVMRAKRLAPLSIGIDLDADALDLALVGGPGLAKSGDGPSFPRATSAAARGAGVLRFDSLASFEVDCPAPDPLAGCGDRPPRVVLIRCDALDFLSSYAFDGRELVYCDPPYLGLTRRGARVYAHEMMDLDTHGRLLAILRRLPCAVMISGYLSAMYHRALKGWNSERFQVMTRGGTPAEEWIWYNFPRPAVLHEYTYLGEGFRERERIKRKKARWVRRLRDMPILERQALFSAIADTVDVGEGAGAGVLRPASPTLSGSTLAESGEGGRKIPRPGGLARSGDRARSQTRQRKRR
jgi:hypothetical protein